ncbi:MAG: threonine synthase [Hyphomicrobiales bacterium]
MKYVSTRGDAPSLSFCEAVLAGLARDGGLYLPERWPILDEATIAGFAGKPYADVAYSVIHPFVDGEIDDNTLRTLINEAYATFRHPAVTPLIQVADNEFVLELFHGPTLAFKDVAMQLLSRLMDHVLSHKKHHATIVGATSGDTGGAAIEAFRGRSNTDIFILFPQGRVSDVQRRQMTTVSDGNVHALAIEGNFDDCQAIVKSMFTHLSFRDEVALSGVNSINWGRIVAQIVYYFTAASALGAPKRKISFTVPTGNFGDIFAGYVAKQMGLPIDRLVIATNRNDILARTLETGNYHGTGVEKTISPSMDIQVSSNFERLLFELYQRDGAEVKTLMERLKQAGSFTIEEAPLSKLRVEFDAGRSSEEETADEIKRTHEKAGYLLDPHTAVGRVVARNTCADAPVMVTLGTAHPAKFPDAVKAATGVHPKLPEWMGDLMQREEKFTVLPNDQKVVEAFIKERTRAVSLKR